MRGYIIIIDENGVPQARSVPGSVCNEIGEILDGRRDPLASPVYMTLKDVHDAERGSECLSKLPKDFDKDVLEHLLSDSATMSRDRSDAPALYNEVYKMRAGKLFKAAYEVVFGHMSTGDVENMTQSERDFLTDLVEDARCFRDTFSAAPDRH